MALCQPVFFALTSSTWDSLSDGVAILIIAVLLLLGLALGYALRSLVGRWQADAIEKKMKLREDAFESEMQTRREKAEIDARMAVVKAEEKFEDATKKRRAEWQAASDRLTQREVNLDKKATLMDAREAAVSAKADAAEAAARAAKEAAETADRQIALARTRLEAIAKMTREEARREILTRVNGELREDAAILSRRIQEAAREQGTTIARRMIADAVQGCAVAHLNELTTTAVALPNSEMKGRIVGRDGRNVRAFESATGVTLLLDDTPETVVLSAFNPLRREVARLALTALVADGRIHPASVEAAVAAAKESVEKSRMKAGESAAAEAGVPGLSPEVLRLMGGLAYRTSFSQNVLRHSVEVALLTGAMAAEMGLDAAKARRVGFLHDIGKALTGEKKGAHAALGAEFLAARGEDAAVCSAVAAHHQEGGVDGGVLGILCAAADAVSSARPGARQENLNEYVQRLEKIETLARDHRGVTHAFAVQAGRDLRVIVDPGMVSDQDAASLAGEICREISSQVKFPGMIRVTVVRESRCVEYAK